MGIEQFAQRHPHRVLDGAGPLDMAGNAEQLRAGVVRPADAGKPMRAAPHDIGHDGDGFDVLTVVGEPYSPTLAGNGGFRRG
jgi:hypothetical protein